MFDANQTKRAVNLSNPLKLNTCSIARKEVIFNLLQAYATSILGQLAGQVQ